MALPLPELRAKEIPHRLSQLSLAAFSRAGFNDPDPAVTPIVLQGHLASTDISVSILIDTGASLDAVSEKYARKHGLAVIPLLKTSAAILPNGARLALSHKCRIPLRLSSDYFTYVNAFVLPLTSIDVILGMPFGQRHNAMVDISGRSLSLQVKDVTHVLTEPAEPRVPHNSLAGIAGHAKNSRPATITQPARNSAAPIFHSSARRSAAHNRVASSPISDIRSATVSGNDALSRRQWNRARRCHQFSQADVLVFTVSDDQQQYFISDANANQLGTISRSAPDGRVLSAMSTDSNDIETTIENYIGHNRARLAAEAADLPDRLQQLLLQYKEQFKDFPDTLPELDTDLLQRIHVSEGPPPASRPYRLSAPQLASCREQLDKLLSAGLIRPAASPFAAPVLMVPKPGGKWRLTVDYRALNARMKRDSFPLPHPADVFNELAGHKYFSRLDLASGFWQIRLDPRDEDKSAFVAASLGQYAWRVLPMGLCTAPSVFARLMQKVLKPLLGVCATTYLDDMGIYGDTISDSLTHLQQTLEALKQHKLYANFRKCHFLLKRMEFLGHLVSENGIEVDPSKVSSISDWPRPTTVSQLRSFLGLVNYYREYIDHFAHRAGALTNLLSATVSFDWGPDQTRAFSDLKAAVTSAPVLQPFRVDSDHMIEADASSVGLGAVLLQADVNSNIFRPVAFHSRKLSSAEKNYPTREQELLALVDSVKHWRHYLLGAPFSIRTDHKSLEYLQTQPHLSGRLVRWSQYLQEYEFTLKHIRGVDNVVADALSRRYDHNEPVTPSSCHLRPDLARNEAAGSADARILHAMSAVQNNFTELVRAAQLSDPWCIELRRRINGTPAKDPVHKTYQIADNDLLETKRQYKSRIVVPVTAKALRNQLLQEAHDTAYGAHLGLEKTYQRLCDRWYWKSMWIDTHKYVISCHTCIANKPSNRQPLGEARPLPVPTHPWVQVGLDISGPHVTSRRGNTWLLVFVDHLAKQVHLAAAPGHAGNPLSAEVCANLFFSTVVKHHGLPDILVSDRGSQWLSEFWRKLFKHCGTNLRFSTAYHPETDGLSERTIRTVIDTLRCCLDGTHEAWDEHLDAIELALNSSVSASTGLAPFEIVYGNNVRLPLSLPTACDPATSFLSRRETARLRAADAIQEAQLRQAAQINKHRRPADMTIGDLVWLSTKHLNLAAPGKFQPKYLGPFPVTHVTASGNAVTLDLPELIRVKSNTFNVSDLREHVARPADLPRSAPSQPPPVFTDAAGVPSYEIDKITAHELTKRGGVKYLIRWQGFAPANDTWQYETELLTQHGGRVAVGHYRARRQDVEAMPSYKLRTRNGRNAPLPTLRAATAKRVADSLRSYDVALQQNS